MDKRTKRQINKKVSDFERECLIEMLFESDDENVKDALEQALLVVKLIHSEEIAEEVEEHRQKLIDEAKNEKNTQSEIEKIIKEMKRKRNIERKNQDMWKKVNHDYWIDYYTIRPDYGFDKWITTSTVSADTSSKVTISPIDSVNKWLTQLDK